MSDKRPARSPLNRWTDDLDAKILAMKRAGDTYAQMGNETGRTPKACRTRLHKLLYPEVYYRVEPTEKAETLWMAALAGRRFDDPGMKIKIKKDTGSVPKFRSVPMNPRSEYGCAAAMCVG